VKKIILVLVLVGLTVGAVWAEGQKITVLSVERNVSDRPAEYVQTALMKRDFKKLFGEYDELELIDLKESAGVVKASGYDNMNYIGKEKITELGAQLNADIVLWGDISSISNSEFKLVVNILDMKSAELASVNFNVKKASKSRLAALKEHLITKIQEFSGGQVEKLMDIAVQQFNSKNFPSAKEAFENVLEVDAENWQAYFYLGFISSSRDFQDHDSAIIHFEKAHELNAENSEILNQMSKTYLRMDDLENAVSSLEQMAELEPENKEIWMRIGEIHAENESTDDAQEAFEKALEIDEEYVDANEALGFLFYDQEYYNDAIPYLEKASDAKPDSDALQKKLAKCYHKAGRLDAAIAKYESVVEKNPDNTKAYFNLAGAYRINEQYQDALTALLKVKELDPENESVFLRLGDVYLVMKKYSKAETNAVKAKELDPENYEPYSLLAQVKKEQGYVKYEEFLKHEEEYKDKSVYYGAKADEKVELRENARKRAHAYFAEAENLLTKAMELADSRSAKKDINASIKLIKDLQDATKASDL